MKRRQFLKHTMAIASVSSLASEASRAADRQTVAGREFYQLRRYRLKDESGVAALSAYVKSGLLPALNRGGFKPVGAFKELGMKEGAAVWMIIPMSGIERAGNLALSEISHWGGSEAAWLGAEKSKPSFERIDSWLHMAFEGLPRLVVPDLTHENQARIFEMRTYESHSEVKAIKKIAMFNAGEIEVMKEVKLRPVFYGQALIGSDLPHLTYMLCGENREAHKKHFEAFTKHPIWLKLKDDPAYADTVSKITSRFLEPLEFSQI